MKTKCYSVRIKSLRSISAQALKITTYDGSSDIFPKSHVFDKDCEVTKSEAYWISAWILEKKKIQYSTKKVAYFDSKTGKRLPTIIVTTHTPEKVEPIDNNTIERLKK